MPENPPLAAVSAILRSAETCAGRGQVKIAEQALEEAARRYRLLDSHDALIERRINTIKLALKQHQ